MRLFRRKNDATKTKGKVASQETQGRIYVSSLCSNAENVFAQLRPLVDELKMVEPFGVGRNGARLPLTRTPELAVLQSPNDKMGWAEFADLMFSTWLTEKELNIHVWKDRSKVYGYSVLPVGARKSMGGEEYFETSLASGGVARYSRDEVMTLRFSRNPKEIDSGISPGIASMVWAQIDDVMAQYQLGHFENGAVPAYITIIRASSHEKYLEKRKEMERGFHGAKNKGKTLFLWRQFLDDGSEKDEVEVKTIQGSNASLAIKDIMSIVNDKLNKAFGVSNFILGDDSSAKYDNAELSQQQFLSHRVYPALFSFWSQFQHELDRVTGGLGYSISWELEIPELTDRLKVKAEIKKIETETRKLEDDMKNSRANMLLTLIKAGATPDAVVKALGLDNRWLEVARSLITSSTEQNDLGGIVQINTQVHDHHQSSQDGHQNCSHCHHTHDALEPKFSVDEVVEQQIYRDLMKLIESSVAEIIGQGVILNESEIQAIVDKIVEALKAEADKGANTGAEEIQAIVLGATGDEIAGVLENGGYHLSDEFYENINSRTEDIVSRLQDEAKDVARKVLNNTTTPMSASQVEKALSDVLPKYRAATIARNETVFAFRAGHLQNDGYIAQKYGLKMKKVWRAHPGACDICQAMDGKEVDQSEAFPDIVEGKDGIQYAWKHDKWNLDGQITSAHVNCRCYFETIVEGYND